MAARVAEDQLQEPEYRRRQKIRRRRPCSARRASGSGSSRMDPSVPGVLNLTWTSGPVPSPNWKTLPSEEVDLQVSGRERALDEFAEHGIHRVSSNWARLSVMICSRRAQSEDGRASDRAASYVIHNQWDTPGSALTEARTKEETPSGRRFIAVAGKPSGHGRALRRPLRVRRRRLDALFEEGLCGLLFLALVDAVDGVGRVRSSP